MFEILRTHKDGQGSHQENGSQADLQDHVDTLREVLAAVELQFVGDKEALECQSWYAHKMFYKRLLWNGEDVEALVTETNTQSPVPAERQRNGSWADLQATKHNLGGGGEVGAFVAPATTP